MKKSMLALKLFLLCVFIAASAANAEGNITVAAIEIVVENPDPVVVTAAPPVAVEAAVVVSDASKTVYVFPPAQTVAQTAEQEVVVVVNSESTDTVYVGAPEPLEKEPPVVFEDETIPKPVEEERTWDSFVDTTEPKPVEEERTSSSASDDELPASVEEERTSSSVTDDTLPAPVEEKKKEEFTSEADTDNTIPEPVETPEEEEKTSSSATDHRTPRPVENKKDKEAEEIADYEVPNPVNKKENSAPGPMQDDNDGDTQQTVTDNPANQSGNTGESPFEDESEPDESVMQDECYHTIYNRPLDSYYVEHSSSHHLTVIHSERVCRWCDYTTGETNKNILPEVHVFSSEGICFRCGYKQDNDEQECIHNYLNIMAEKNSGVWRSKGKSGHWCASIKYRQQCEYCGLEQVNEVADPYNGEVQKHMLNSNVGSIYDYNKNEHWIVGAEMECTAKGCGYSEIVDIHSGRKTAHQFEDGHCVCGYEEDCEEESRAPDTSGVINGALFSEESNYAFDVFRSYVEANGGIGLYGSIVIDTVMNIGDLLKMEGVDLSEAKAIRTVQLAVESLDEEYYVEAVDGAGMLIKELIYQHAEGSKEALDGVEKTNDFISKLMDTVGDRWGFGAEFQAGEMIRLEELIEGLEEADDEAREILMLSYNNAYNTNLKYEQLLQGLGEWEKVSKAVGDVTKVAGAVREACSVLSDYAVQSAKLEVVKEAIGSGTLDYLADAIEYMENYYDSELARLFSAGTDEAISFVEGKSSVWQAVKNVFKYTPGDVDNDASSCIALVDLEEMVLKMETDLERSLVNVGNGKSGITADELKKKMHALVDLKILSTELAQNLTWSEYKDGILSQNIEAMEKWHDQIDDIVEGWYQ